MAKRFNKKLFEKYDEANKLAVIKLFESILPDIYVAKSPEKYDADLILFSVEDREPICFIEVETKRGWSTASYPFEDLRFCERKLKYKNGHGLPVWHVTLNRYGTHAAWVSEDLQQFPLEEVETYQQRSLGEPSERFFVVPLEHVRFFEIPA